MKTILLFVFKNVSSQQFALRAVSKGAVTVVIAVVFVKIPWWIGDEILHSLTILLDLFLNVCFITNNIIGLLSNDLHFLRVISILKHHRIT